MRYNNVNYNYGPRYYKFRNQLFEEGHMKRYRTTAEIINAWCDKHGETWYGLDKRCREHAHEIESTWAKNSINFYAKGRFQPKAEKLEILSYVMDLPVATVLGFAPAPKIYRAAPGVAAMIRGRRPRFTP